ncbi:MAG: ABC transporter permease [Armatimonadetes bacterium]|nr:ABC transporter permease [Armatimonadota bacterium]
MVLRSLPFFFREVALNLKRNPVMTIASASTVLVLVIVLGVFSIVAVNLVKFSRVVSSQFHMTAFLSENMSLGDAMQIQKQISGLPHVARIRYVSSEEALKRVGEWLKEEINLEGLVKNPFPSSFDIYVDDPTAMDEVAIGLGKIQGIKDLNYARKEAARMVPFLRNIKYACIVLIALLLFTTVLIVSNTIKLTVFARRREIEIMQLVGAAHWFIRWPFILEGVLQGLFGSAVAVTLLYITYTNLLATLVNSVPWFPLVSNPLTLHQILAALVASGCIVGGAGSFIAVNRFLRV